MPNLKPFRDYSEHDVINFFSCTREATKGTIVKPVLETQKNPVFLTNNAPGARYFNTITDLFEISGKIEPTVSYTDKALGILLYDVREKDENGEKLIFNPRKASELGIVLPNIHSAPVLTKGLVVINDIDISSRTPAGGGVPEIGDAAYLGDNGRIGTDGILKIGKFLSLIDSDGYCIVKVDFN